MFKFEGEKVFQLRENKWVLLTTEDVVKLLKTQLEIFCPEKVFQPKTKSQFNFDGI